MSTSRRVTSRSLPSGLRSLRLDDLLYPFRRVTPNYSSTGQSSTGLGDCRFANRPSGRTPDDRAKRPSSATLCSMNRHQPGIFADDSSHHIFLEFAAPDPTSKLPCRTLVERPMEAGWEVVAFGPELIAGLADMSSPPGMRGFSAIQGIEGFTSPATQHDLLVWLHGNRRDELFVRALAWRDALASVANVAREDHGFRFRDSRDLTGFVDGTANPKADARLDAALVGNGDHAGGSFVLAQRWVHDLTRFSALAVGDQERVIGRTKPDSVELTGDAMPRDSHVSRTDITRDGKAVKIYRRSAPSGGIRDPGLYFLAFSADLDRFDWLLQSMFGLSGDARRDRLLSYSRPVSGSYFYAPPLDALRACLDG